MMNIVTGVTQLDNENEIYTAIIPYAGRSTAKKTNKKAKIKEVPRRTFVPVRRVLQSIQISTNTDCIVTRLGRRGRAEGADAVMHGTVWYGARWWSRDVGVGCLGTVHKS